MHLFDVAEEIDPERLREALNVAQTRREPSFSHRAPEYVRFERPPVSEPGPSFSLDSREPMLSTVRYYDSGVVSVQLSLEFVGTCQDWAKLAARYTASEAAAAWSTRTIRERLAQMPQILIKPYSGEWIGEDYYVIQVEPLQDAGGEALTAKRLLAEHGSDIAQMIRGESKPLSEEEQREILSGVASYYPTDLLLAGWNGALIYDTAEGAQPSIELLEYANSQLLVYRHYDLLLTQLLDGVYDSLEEGTGIRKRWRLAREAARLNTIRLDITELTERTDNALKFLSDMFDARVYRLAAQKVGVNDYRALVEQKLRTAGDLYTFMVDQFHQARAFVLELMVVIILIIDLIVLFKDAF
jgi:hypothetical protein